MKKMKRPFSSSILIFLVLFQAFGAIPSGCSMIVDPTGRLMGLPQGILEQSPFSDFLIPGLFLGIVLGLFPLVIAYGLITKKEFPVLQRINLYNKYHWALSCSYYLGIVLVLWISAQFYFGMGVHILHLVYTALGILIIVFSQLPDSKAYYSMDENRTHP